MFALERAPDDDCDAAPALDSELELAVWAFASGIPAIKAMMAVAVANPATT